MTETFDTLSDALDEAAAMSAPDAYRFLRLRAATLEDSPLRQWFMQQLADRLGLLAAIPEPPTLALQEEAMTWPRLKLEEGDEVAGALMGWGGVYIAVAIPGSEHGGVALTAHKNLLAALRPLQIGTLVRIKCLTKQRPQAFEYEVEVI